MFVSLDKITILTADEKESNIETGKQCKTF